ncbi:MAG: 3-phosphoshikimate 1-carboxyvinyltransferase [bacterium]|nr:3-phosphoshikimate 1-carboxyvinyltransferase [bacterium]
MSAKKIAVLAKPIKYSISVPGSKSLMNRALICAALASGQTKLTNPNYCEDTVYLIKALQSLGVTIKQHADYLLVKGIAGKFKKPSRALFLGNAGTATRFLTPLVPVGTSITGDKHMQQRPLDDLLKALYQLGFDFESKTGCPPVKIISREQTSETIDIPGKISSQYLSAILMMAPTLKKPLTINVRGTLVSKPYVEMTIAVMKQFGVSIRHEDFKKFFIKPQVYQFTKYEVPADASSATYWWTLAAITGSSITVDNLHDNKQADFGYLQILKKMGCQVKGTTVTGSEELWAVSQNMKDMPDAVMSLAMVAACATGVTEIKNISHLKAKETNRLKLLISNLRKVGIRASTNGTNLKITGDVGKINGKRITTEDDHRFAMAFAILGLRFSNMSIDKSECVKKSYPAFWQDIQKCQQASKKQTILLTGMRGSGKSTIGKNWAKKYGASFIDLDEEIEKEISMSISQYVKNYGWKKFRNVEIKITKRFIDIENAVIATGGGTLMNQHNYVNLKHYYIVLMYAPVSELRRRVQNDKKTSKSRPALLSDTQDELGDIWKKRKYKYYQVADKIYDSRNPR